MTERFVFRTGFANSRMFFTFLYGNAMSREKYIARAPPEYRAAFAANVFRGPSSDVLEHEEL